MGARRGAGARAATDGFARLREIVESTTRTTAMVFILIGGRVLARVPRLRRRRAGAGIFEGMPGGGRRHDHRHGRPARLILDFIEITFVVVPIVGPVLLAMGLDPVWLGVMIAVNLQTSFLTPPFGFALFYLRGVAPEVRTTDIYRVVPFIVIQLILLGLRLASHRHPSWLSGSRWPNAAHGPVSGDALHAPRDSPGERAPPTENEAFLPRRAEERTALRLTRPTPSVLVARIASPEEL